MIAAVTSPASLSAAGPVSYVRDGQVARITMDDGKVNVMSLAMLDALHAAIDRAAADQAIIVLSSGRDVFSAGFDLKVFAANDPEKSLAMVKAGAELALKLYSHPLPVIGACRGHAFPMGAFLLLASDVRIGGAGAWRIGLNEVAIGIPVPSFALELARSRLHPAWFQRTALTGEMFVPDDAMKAGFLDKIVPAGALDAAVNEAAAQLSKIHLPSHAIVKRRVRASAIAAIRAAIDAEMTLDAYRDSARSKSAVRLPGAA
ncbi:MAG TPA: crotonase/enoyl-CoA hydratase family protein [Hyphomonadaceae bacterium]|jgi:enoyl-CoA hydratase|nr:crotonase/enoyl-CoA hydratase family protein [Hyphomonadaceae bacterium]